MKNFLFFVLIFVASSAFSKTLNWSELDFDTAYTLNSDIEFTDKVKLNKGDVLSFEDRGQGDAPVIYFSFINASCIDAKLTAEMVLFNPEPQDHMNDKSIGVQLVEGCRVWMYVEPQFYYNISVLDAR